MSHERALGLVLLAGAVAFAGICWWTGLYPRTPLPPDEDEATAAVRAMLLDAVDDADLRLGQLARQLRDIGGNGYRTASHPWRNLE